MSELDDIAEDISMARDAMQNIISGADRIDVGRKTQTTIIDILGILSRVVEQVRRIDDKGTDDGEYDAPPPSPVPGTGDAVRTHGTVSDMVYDGPTIEGAHSRETVGGATDTVASDPSLGSTNVGNG